ncbi:GNAT family N-acetyltransferase [Rubrobacter tropicus]|uniref:GNAT family N-acetyltransferase n=1 Tax=Rubrobacter tropicus TaxID=2653851 RepID=A0A6G8QE90_9ACTN|nr:GNAT family N-acetyltransferase [Rubrobacter tropicus]QIN84799.1 GNAT family N-acetyltransferase [Rubrobacter tropicus]
MDITVRHAEPSDADALHRIFQARSVVAGTLQLPFPRLSLWQERLRNPPEGLYQLVACVEDEVVGELTLSTTPNRPRLGHVGSIGMAVRDEWQGKGVGTALMEAALDLAHNWLALTRIELEVYTDNAAGIALYERFGFEREGTHRRYAFRDGGYVDAYSMARLKG